MPQHFETLEVAQSSSAVWALLGEPERWFVGYRSTRQRSPDYPAPGTHSDYVFHTRVDENVAVRVSRSEPPSLLEEEHDGRTFKRRILYRLEEAGEGTCVRVEDEITFKGLARLAGPIAFDDVKRRWRRSLDLLRVAVESDAQDG